MNNWLDRKFDILFIAIIYSTFTLLMITYFNIEFTPSSMTYKSALLIGLFSLATGELLYVSKWKNVLFILFICTFLYFVKSNIDIFLSISKDILVWLFNSHMIIV